MVSANPVPQVLSPSRRQKVDNISLPFNYTPREYQEKHLFRPMFPYLYDDLRLLGVKRKDRICLPWHRRAGKDLSSVNVLVMAAQETVGNYLHLLPEQTQAKKAIWRGIDKTGIRFMDRIPSSIIKKKYESEMLIEFHNGSTYQCGGADNYNSWMGTNPRGLILSEYSLQDPMAWTYLRPILTENEGWAIFIYTARGKNHGYDLYNVAKANPERWHCALLTIEDTLDHYGNPVISQAQYLQEIEDGMPEAMARQEFYVDFEASLVGSYFGDLLEKAHTDGRIGYYPHDPAKPVFTSWDLGLDGNVVVFAQQTEGGDPRIIDCFSEANTKFSDVCKEVNEKPYVYGAHFGPHDAANRDPEKNTRLNTARDLGIDIIVTPRSSRDDGIEAVRLLLPRCQFHAENLDYFIDCMKSYHRLWDDKLKVFREQPVHNFASHTADAFRIMAVNWSLGMVDTTWLTKELVPNSDVNSEFSDWIV